jgi:hypothetical protein
VKQINVQTAAALAEAREVLVSGRQSENINSGKENLESPNAKKEPGATTKLQAKIKVRIELLIFIFPCCRNKRSCVETKGGPGFIVCCFSSSSCVNILKLYSSCCLANLGL